MTTTQETLQALRAMLERVAKIKKSLKSRRKPSVPDCEWLVVAVPKLIADNMALCERIEALEQGPDAKE